MTKFNRQHVVAAIAKLREHSVKFGDSYRVGFLDCAEVSLPLGDEEAVAYFFDVMMPAFNKI